ncbi:transglutaminase family protein, partial [Klebsiella aerogenes]|uniref:transglutaminase family protein n=1 Tax=Klebsiella aerogenes TaxID=548 RepID=UPI0013D3EBD2
PISVDDAGALAAGIATRLGLDAEAAVPAYEDPAHWVLKESDLPVNVDALDSKLEDAEARARIARVFERGLTKP